MSSGQAVCAADQVLNWVGRDKASAPTFLKPGMCADVIVKVDAEGNVSKAAKAREMDWMTDRRDREA